MSPELGTAQPQLVSVFGLILAEDSFALTLTWERPSWSRGIVVETGGCCYRTTLA